MKKIILFLTIISIGFASPTIEQLAKEITKLKENLNKNLDTKKDSNKELQKETMTLSKKVQLLQALRKFKSVKEKSGSSYFKNSLEIAIKKAKRYKTLLSTQKTVILDDENGYSVGKKKYIYIDRDKLDSVIKKLDSEIKDRKKLDYIINSLKTFKSLTKENLVAYEQEINKILNQTNRATDISNKIVNNYAVSKTGLNNSIAIYLGEKLSENIKVLKIDVNKVVIGTK